MRLSVIIPTLNESGAIGLSVRCARAVCDRVDWGEVIVADGGSSDDTLARAAEAGARVLTCPPGRGSQLRRGIEASGGDTLLLLHADCQLAPEGADQIREALKQEGVGAGAFRQAIDADGVLYRMLESGNAFRARHLGLPYGDQGLFVRRRLLDAVGGMPDLPLMEDVELMRRLRRRTRLVFLPGPLRVSARRWKQQGVVRQTIKNWALLIAYLGGVPADRLAPWYRPPGD